MFGRLIFSQNIRSRYDCLNNYIKMIMCLSLLMILRVYIQKMWLKILKWTIYIVWILKFLMFRVSRIRAKKKIQVFSSQKYTHQVKINPPQSTNLDPINFYYVKLSIFFFCKLMADGIRINPFFMLIDGFCIYGLWNKLE